MRSILITFTMCFICNLFTNAQNNAVKSDDANRITLATYVPKQTEGLTPDVQNLLTNKLSQIASKNGMGASSKGNERFVITVNIVVLSKDITPTAPPMHVYNLEATLYIGDGMDGTLFASKSYELEGVGDSKTEAYKNALSSLKTSDPSIKTFIEEGKKRIIEYYNSKCDFIIKEAQTLEAKQDYQQAIYKLTNVPQVCKECFDKCQSLVGPIYQKFIDLQCKKYINEANNLWATKQDYSGAEKASEILNKIEPNSSCYKDAIVLSDKIAKRIKEIDQREWNFKLKQQQDAVDIEKATIKAARDVGVAYGENQPNVVYETVVYGWW